LSFIIYYFTQNPEAQEKIFEETLHMKENLTVEDLSRAFYTRAAIHEAFRLSPSAFAIARMLEDDLYLSGYHVKSGVSNQHLLSLFMQA
jgi:cytochrome P450